MLHSHTVHRCTAECVHCVCYRPPHPFGLAALAAQVRKLDRSKRLAADESDETSAAEFRTSFVEGNELESEQATVTNCY